MANRDPYGVLGVSRGASADDVRRAYRKLARELHPDVNKAPDAAKRFSEVQEAYEILSNEEKRRNYDMYGDPAGPVSSGVRGGRSNGKHAGGPFGYGGMHTGNEDFDNEDLASLFESIFAGRGTSSGTGGGAGPGGGSRGGRASSGGFGSGFDFGPRSESRARASKEPASEHPITIPFSTAYAGGQTTIHAEVGGKKSTIEVTIPRGIADGAKLRVRVPTGASGGKGKRATREAILVVRVEPHPLFVREGDSLDLSLELPVTIAEASLGAQVTIPTPSGKGELKVPAGYGRGQRLRLRGQGMVGSDGKVGDLYVTPRIMPIDAETLDDSARETLQRLSEQPGVRSGPAWQR
ncbi:MAG: DnaJ domain-containing protein [Planctomycetota bacterium]|nr:DnaJ domain-containing protein [Planctomycetota bacterium]